MGRRRRNGNRSGWSRRSCSWSWSWWRVVVGVQPLQSGHSYHSLGTATTVGVYQRSRSRSGRARRCAGASRSGSRSGSGSGQPRHFLPDPTGTPTVLRPRPSWQCPDCRSSTPTVVAVPRLLPATTTPTTVAVAVSVTVTVAVAVAVAVAVNNSIPFQRRAYTRTQSTSIRAGNRVVLSGDPRKRPPTARFITR